MEYIGNVPDFKNFNDISYFEYTEYCNKYNMPGSNWNLRYELIKYCEQDCRTLHQIINKFNDLIISNFNISIYKYPTLPSLSFALYRQNYLQDNTIPQIAGQNYKDIQLSYTGG